MYEVLDVIDAKNPISVLVEDEMSAEWEKIRLTASEWRMYNCYFQSDAERAVWLEEHIEALLLRNRTRRVRDLLNKFDFAKNPEVLDQIERLLNGGE